MAILEDLIIEILSRLPVKSLLKFRSISNSWLCLISSPAFIKKHLNLSANQYVLLLDCGEKRKYKECPVKSLFDDSVAEALELDHPFNIVINEENWLFVQGSCDGLVYLSCDDCLEHSLLWNPTTRKHNKLPSFGPPGAKPAKRAFGFGYDELQDDYKVVIVSSYYAIDKSDPIEIKVYSLKTDSWTKVDYCDEETFSIKNIPNYCSTTLIGTASFVAGKLHWGTIIDDTCSGNVIAGNIIAFDLSCEKWEKVETPSYGEEEYEMFVEKLGSDLSVFTNCKTTHVGVWVMKEYGVKESWKKMFTITRLDDHWIPCLSVSNKGEILSMSWSNSMVYNSKDDSFGYLHIANCQCGRFDTCYLESMVSPFPAQGTDNMEEAICPSFQLLCKCTCDCHGFFLCGASECNGVNPLISVYAKHDFRI